jgi:putative ATP-binding cassette transporter
MTRLKETDKADIRYFNALTDIIDGLKEIKLHREKGEDIYDDFIDISKHVRSLKIDVNHLFAQNMVFAQSYVFLVLGAIVFILPQFKDTFVQEIVSTTTAMLFAIGPLSSLIATLPYYEKINLCISNIYDLEAELDRQMNPDELAPAARTDRNPLGDFKEIEINNLCFDYHNRERQDRFSVGPINLKIKKGDIVFVVGGNGSGKTTLLKVLTTLYKADSGGIYVDDRLVDAANFHDFRELFSAIFYDFHLFTKLYGLSQVDQRQVDALLTLMEIDHKTQFKDGRFTQLNLSTGQRKRLAMIVSLLEDKPIYIFDEWAADQDPAFKDYFYNELLEKLKSQGKTVIAVSHDDRYFDRADNIIKLEFGKIVAQKQRSRRSERENDV